MLFLVMQMPDLHRIRQRVERSDQMCSGRETQIAGLSFTLDLVTIRLVAERVDEALHVVLRMPGFDTFAGRLAARMTVFLSIIPRRTWVPTCQDSHQLTAAQRRCEKTRNSAENRRLRHQTRLPRPGRSPT